VSQLFFRVQKYRDFASGLEPRKLEEIIKFKYQNLRKSIEKAEQRLAKINEIIREKNPSLLLQIYKSTAKK
jgi:prephenate dehydrogenase